MIFVFGSNLSGIHGAGAAKVARLQYGAIWGQAFGPMGTSYAIPTKDTNVYDTLPLVFIAKYVDMFIDYAKKNTEEVFQVTRIGCGLAGLKDEDVAPLFEDTPLNCLFDRAWENILGNSYNYWGTF